MASAASDVVGKTRRSGFADANQDEEITLISQWTSRWRTSVAIDGYHWGGTDAEKFVATWI
jgi:hypothetical protein